MAYEISEGAAAAAMFLKDSDYKKLNGGTEAAAVEVMGLIYKNLDNVIMSGEERIQYKGWFNPNKETKGKHKGTPFLEIPFKGKGKDARLTAVIHGCSAAMGIKEWFKSMKHNDIPKPKNVFVTGAGFDPDISFLKMRVGDWDDYNSSDIVIILGRCYYGISLKKKPRKSSADPPMINKSIVKMLTELKQEDLGDKFWDARVGFYGDIIETQMGINGALEGSDYLGFSAEDLFLTQIYNPISKKWVNLIDLKGEGKLELSPKPAKERGKIRYEWKSANKGAFIDGVDVTTNEDDFAKTEVVRKLFAYDTDPTRNHPEPINESGWKMRKAVNNALGQTNDLFDIINSIVKDDDLAKLIGENLLNSILKTELQGEFDKLKKIHTDKHFGFALVTAVGEFKTGSGKNAIGKITSHGRPASYKSDPTMQQTISDLIAAGKNKNWKMQIDKATTQLKQERATRENVGLPAKLFFQIGLEGSEGFINALNLELRYKGAFSVSPQFLGGMSGDFTDILNQKNQAKSYTFGKACNG